MKAKSIDSQEYLEKLRDTFAGQVMQGDAAVYGGWAVDASPLFIECRTVLYYKVADAMLEARKK